jgi:uncharacterized protein Yka (UPF0111/DUF47 family)
MTDENEDSARDIGIVMRGLEKLGQNFHSDVERMLAKLSAMERTIISLIGRVSDVETEHIRIAARVSKLETLVDALQSSAPAPPPLRLKR